MRPAVRLGFSGFAAAVHIARARAIRHSWIPPLRVRPSAVDRRTARRCYTLAADDFADKLAMLADDPTDYVEEWPDDAPVADPENFADVAEAGGDVGFRYSWADEHGHGEEVASIMLRPVWDGRPRFDATLDGVTRADRADALEDRPTHLRFEYATKPHSGEPTESEYPVTLEYTPCTFGGVRPPTVATGWASSTDRGTATSSRAGTVTDSATRAAGRQATR